MFMKLFQLFRKAGATGEVYLLKRGGVQPKGLAWSGFVGPMTTVAVVPAVDQVCPFSLTAQTADKQKMEIAGDVTVRFDSAKAVKAFDFTVDIGSGNPLSQWQTALQALVSERVLSPLREKAQEIKTEDVPNSHSTLERAIEDALKAGKAGKLLAEKGVCYVSGAVSEAAPADEDVAESVGAAEREEMLADADRALHERRMEGVKNERRVKTFEASTLVVLEKEKAKLVEEQGKNELARATSDAKASSTRLEPFANVAPEVVLVASLMKMGERGVGSLTVGPELIGVLRALKSGT